MDIPMLEHIVASVADGIRKLNEDGHNISEREIMERGRNIVQGLIGGYPDVTRLLGDRERCIYWLLRVMERSDTTPQDVGIGILNCLLDMDYHPAADRSKAMLEMGEAGTALPPADRRTS